MEDKNNLSSRIVVFTNGIWRANQISEFMLALDGLSTRIAVALKISELCHSSDNLISNMRILGLLGKRKDFTGEFPSSPKEAFIRADFIDFVKNMRSVGIDVKPSSLGLKFSFGVKDLIDIAPISSRAEIESISMSSPGKWSLIISELLGTKEVFIFLEKIFDSIFFNKSIRMKKEGEGREALAKAKIVEEKVRESKAHSDLEQIKVYKEVNNLILDYNITIESLITTLRNSGFSDAEIKIVLTEKLIRDIDILARFNSIGLVEKIQIEKYKFIEE